MKHFWLIGFILFIVGDVFAESSCTIAEPLEDFFRPGGAMIDFEPVDDAVLRLRGDFTNDGLEDIALTPRGSCGMGTCGWSLYRKCSKTNYNREEDPPGLSLWYSFRVVPIIPGKARIESCQSKVDLKSLKTPSLVKESCSWPGFGDFPCDVVRKKDDRFEFQDACNAPR